MAQNKKTIYLANKKAKNGFIFSCVVVDGVWQDFLLLYFKVLYFSCSSHLLYVNRHSHIDTSRISNFGALATYRCSWSLSLYYSLSLPGAKCVTHVLYTYEGRKSKRVSNIIDI